ncbi:GNAT family N-acetyltransferase [Rhizosphaericola mali]|uniref:N-acetyltransferase n=1 Tax=Rhizosphaericola mali TaxID=2545455 RepID=A0A5P2G0T9_9BACT|nr:GNAT family N-acetyltransferase [Rhizosphaericola mali]QES89424.1 N-acetyltransferase [Rhizosphaericola mali]
MEIVQIDNKSKGFFKAIENQKQAGSLIYSKPNDHLIVIEHTEVKEGFQGRGVGLKLVLEAVDFARAKHLKILPECPYAKSVFEKRDDLQDVLA